MKIPEYKWDVWYIAYGDKPQIFKSCPSRAEARRWTKLLNDLGNKKTKTIRYVLTY